MDILKILLRNLPDGEVLDIRIGLHWTAVVVDLGNSIQCGLASTLHMGHKHTGKPNVQDAGQLLQHSGLELAQFSLSDQPTMASVGVAAINALLPQQPDKWIQANAEEILAVSAKNKKLVIIGHFPIISRLRTRVGDIDVLELTPAAEDLPAHLAPDVLPQARVVAITGMAIINHTLERLLQYCDPKANVMVLGPSTPLTPEMFNFGITHLSGSVVTDIDSVLQVVSQGGNFKQVHKAGVRLVNLNKSDFITTI